MEGSKYEKKFERGCPQGSQLGPTLLKSVMSELLALSDEDNVKVIAYADDIALLVGAARHETVIVRTERYLDKIKKWANTYNLSFSPAKTQVMSVKGGVKPGYTIGFGTERMLRE
ncbi:chaoptin-like [Aphis craccivora]|uniref:Chaoptin-like n=1 Tax=Aphis craccivora TaxID=307492 RepID=A0A6G0VXU3_APHCR|nr:chaoptin-like [Aphis craccivora]